MTTDDGIDSMPRDINYALVETTRPAMYKAMKYWGKKPHNIWSQFIECYCPEGGIVLDPFSGSGVAAFEAVKLGRRAVSFDLNPLSAFFVEVTASPFDAEEFRAAFDQVTRGLREDDVYRTHYLSSHEGEDAVVYNYRWLDGSLSEVVLETTSGKQIRMQARSEDIRKVEGLGALRIPYWFPTDRFPQTPSINHKFIQDIGGDTFDCLWTKRNLYLLAKLFDEICGITDEAIRLQLLSGFVQTLHLTTRMVYPRSTASNRDFSGSWGRADYMIRKKSMEQNPLIIFERSCLGRQGVIAALEDAGSHFPDGIPINDMTTTRTMKKRAQINYGTVDVADLSDYLKPKSIDFILTDPPYAGLVRYLDLSLVWLVWLQHLDPKYAPDLRAEITIKEGVVSREEYRRRLVNAFKQMHRVLKDDGRIVITFHHQQIREWNEFVNAVALSGFKFDKVTHQYNRRSGESNVANPYGTSGSDFYIRCVKQREVDFTDDKSGLEHFIVQKTIEIIARRNEPTPFSFIYEGLVPELLQAGLVQPADSNANVQQILRRHSGPEAIFTAVENSDTKSGDLWWFRRPQDHISHPDRPLSDRVEDTIVALLRRRVSVPFDDVLAELFQQYPNGLTPDIRTVRSILEKYAYPSAGNWKILDTTVQTSTRHTVMIQQLAGIAKRSGGCAFIGKREQPEPAMNGSTLREHASCTNLTTLSQYDAEQIARLEMVDLLWLNHDLSEIKAAFEIENSTNFTSAVQRASNLGRSIPKFMVVPDARERELLSIRDPLFVSNFESYNWRYLTYSDIERTSARGRLSLRDFTALGRVLNP